jgi:hypothetical protein
MKPIKITFTDQFLNSFTGTQEEFDALVKELEEKFANGDFEEIFDEDLGNEVAVGLDSAEMYDQHPRILH